MKIEVKHWKKVIPVLVFMFFLIALRIFYNEIRGLTLAGIKAAVADIPRPRLLLSCAAVVGYCWLNMIIEKYAVAESGLQMPFLRVARVSFISNAIGSSVGASVISGGSFRARYYSEAGAKPTQVARIIAVTQLSNLVGTAGLNGLVLFFWSHEISALIKFPTSLRYAVATVCLAAPAFFILISLIAKRGKDFRIRGYLIPIPEPRIMVRQLAVGFCGPLCSSMVLFFLLPTSHGIGFFVFCGTFALSSMVGALSMVPAGIGVFEGTVVWMLHPFYGNAELLSALLIYRLIYNLIPLIIGVLLLAYDVFRPRYCKSN